MLRDGEVRKIYLAVAKGRWEGKARELTDSLHKHVNAQGERRVSVREDGMAAVTRVKPVKVNDAFSVLELQLMTGRTHQIRVHLAHAGHPVLGDDKYGDFPLNHALAKEGVKRLFLHAHKLSLRHPLTGEPLSFESRLPEDMSAFIKKPPG
jgi:23S rRNA pseudouridine955/2504/2580 synthase